MGARGSLLSPGTVPLVTKAYDLPSKAVLHVTGPQLRRGDAPTDRQRANLRCVYSKKAIDSRI